MRGGTLNNTTPEASRQCSLAALPSALPKIMIPVTSILQPTALLMTDIAADLTILQPTLGSPAPDFSLASTSGNTVTLSAFRGERHVLIAFFPLAFTGTCTKEVCAFSEDFDAFTEKGVEVLPISVDALPSLKEFKKSLSLKVDLLSDFKRVASRAYGVLREDTFYAKRSYFLVDKSGTVRWTFVETVPHSRRENSELLEEIAKLTD